MAKILLIHGPNLNLLGKREPKHYGKLSLDEINEALQKQSEHLKHELLIHQQNAEHEILSLIHQASEQKIDFIIINPAAFTHTSLAIRDALLAVNIPFIEVHLSNIFGRENFRQHSFLADIAVGIIAGFGPNSYELALKAADQYLSHSL